MKAVVFDFDGTLIDSAPDLHAAANRMAKALGLAPYDLAQIASFIGHGVPRLVERCMDARDIAPDDPVRADALKRFSLFYDADLATLTTLYPGVSALLPTLRSAGMRTGLCTNKPHHAASVICSRTGLSPHLDVIVGAGIVAARKPDPEPLLYCLRQIGAGPDDALYVGDSETDEETAHNAGLDFALFRGGYRKKPPEAFNAVFAFDDFVDLGRFIGVMK